MFTNEYQPVLQAAHRDKVNGHDLMFLEKRDGRNALYLDLTVIGYTICPPGFLEVIGPDRQVV